MEHSTIYILEYKEIVAAALIDSSRATRSRDDESISGEAEYAPLNCSIFSASFFLNFPSILVIFLFYPLVKHSAGLFMGIPPFMIVQILFTPSFFSSPYIVQVTIRDNLNIYSILHLRKVIYLRKEDLKNGKRPKV